MQGCGMKKNTGKAPSIQFYMKDWMADVEDHPLDIEGAWLRVCNRIWYKHRDAGRITKTSGEWASVWGVTETESARIIAYIKTKRLG
ncbi:unnamed protein product, partial [marine sediment metagenome]